MYISEIDIRLKDKLRVMNFCQSLSNKINGKLHKFLLVTIILLSNIFDQAEKIKHVRRRYKIINENAIHREATKYFSIHLR